MLEVVGTLGTFEGDDDPPADDRVFAKFGHLGNPSRTTGLLASRVETSQPSKIPGNPETVGPG